MTTWMMDALLDKRTPEQVRRRNENRQRKLKIEHMKVLIVQGKIKESINMAEKIGLTPKQYGRIVASLEQIG